MATVEGLARMQHRAVLVFVVIAPAMAYSLGLQFGERGSVPLELLGLALSLALGFSVLASMRRPAPMGVAQ